MGYEFGQALEIGIRMHQWGGSIMKPIGGWFAIRLDQHGALLEMGAYILIAVGLNCD